MSQRMHCPDPVRLHQHLQGALVEPEESDLLDHLGTCEVCQRSLETMAVENDWLLRAAARAGREPAISDARLSAVLDVLKIDRKSPEPANDAPSWRNFLAPSDDPQFIGRLGQYGVVSVVGQGGMGIVLKAFDEKLERTVAIKLLSPGMLHHPVARSRFLREGRAAAAVRHDNVVTIHDVHEANGVPFSVMEFIDGESLQERLDRSGPLELKSILRIGIQTAQALAAAHAQGLIHRDIKPANILLEDPYDRVKITDFGLARALDEATLTHSGVVAGTPGYMAPEQARGEAVDHRADLLCMGSVLYATCTGLPAFRASGALAALKQVCETEPESIAALNPNIPAALVAIIAKLQAKDPNDRFQSAAEVITALEACQDPAQQVMHSSIGNHRRMQRHTFSVRRAIAAFVLLAIGGLLAAQIVIRIRDKEGNTTEITVPRGGTVTVESNGKILDRIPLEQEKAGEIQQFVGHKGAIRSVVFTPSGQHILSASEDGTVRVWDVATGKVEQQFEGHVSAVLAVAVDPQGKWALSTEGLPGQEESARHWQVSKWEIETGRELQRFSVHGASMTCLEIERDGRRALFGSYGGTVWLYDVENWRELGRFQTNVGLWSVEFSPDGRQMLTAGGYEARGHLRLWSLETGAELKHFDGHRAGIWRAIFLPGGKQIVSASIDRTIRIWDVSEAKELGRLRHSDGVSSIALSRDGRYAVAGGGDKMLRFWDVSNRKELAAFSSNTHDITSVSFSPDEKYAVSGSSDFTVRRWRLPPVEKSTK